MTYPGYPFIPHRFEVRPGIAMSFLDEGPRDDEVVVMLHGNTDVQPYVDDHSRVIGERLKQLVQRGWLFPSNKGRWTRYRLSGSKEGDLFQVVRQSSPQENSEHSSGGSEHYRASSEHYGSEHWRDLEALAAPIRAKGRISRDLVEAAVLQLCSESWLSLRDLARLLGRAPDTLRNHYLRPLLVSGRLLQKFPSSPNHPEQAYRVPHPTAGHE